MEALKEKDKLFLTRDIMFYLIRIMSLVSLVVLFVFFVEGDINYEFVVQFLLYIALILSSYINVFYKKIIKSSIPILLEILFMIFIVGTLFFGEILDFYIKYEYFDDIMHTYSGFLDTIIALTIIYYVSKSKGINIEKSPILLCFLAFSVSMMVAGIWEVIEYTLDEFLGTNMQTYYNDQTGEIYQGHLALLDTVMDLGLGALGGFIAVLIFAIDYNKFESKIFYIVVNKETSGDIRIVKTLILKIKQNKIKKYNLFYKK